MPEAGGSLVAHGAAAAGLEPNPCWIECAALATAAVTLCLKGHQHGREGGMLLVHGVAPLCPEWCYKLNPTGVVAKCVLAAMCHGG